MSISNVKKLTVLSSQSEIKSLPFKFAFLRLLETRLYTCDDALIAYESKGRAETEKRLYDAKRALETILPYSKYKKGIFAEKYIPDLNKFVVSGTSEITEAVVESILEIREELDALKTEEYSLKELYSCLLPFKDYPFALGLNETKNTSFVYVSIPTKTRIGSTEKNAIELEEMKKVVEPFYAELEEINRSDKKRFVRVICHKCDKEEVCKTLIDYGFSYLPFTPEFEKASKMIARVKKLARENLEKQNAVAERLATLAEHERDIEALEMLLGCMLIEIKGEGKYSAMLEAWVPNEKEEKVSEILGKIGCSYSFRAAYDYENPSFAREDVFIDLTDKLFVKEELISDLSGEENGDDRD